ncbi:hypothetical protein GGS23DRAFT_555378 [Durotheca rogersii]|uniref:uncharacterized protein n=1 Tax=Durotheca rogersii TaxID=419775 RepID=UPI00221E4703|nr:uncharacterized protein GGS23DRAFT_555378 [Durotheca rogersii]KAI5866079.1 hypothetical protein GGS23DRAFT_555378 [Durotheca rogersii]
MASAKAVVPSRRPRRVRRFTRPSDWPVWNADFIEMLEVLDLLPYITTSVLDPAGCADAQTRILRRNNRFLTLCMIRDSLSLEMKNKLVSMGCNIFDLHGDPKMAYDLIRKIAHQEDRSDDEDTEGQEGKDAATSMISTPLASNAAMEDLAGEDGDEGWTPVELAAPPNFRQAAPESIQDRIVRVRNDLRDLTAFYNIEGSASRYARLDVFYRDELFDLERQPFDSYTSQEDRVDHLLLRNYIRRARRTLQLDRARDAKFAAFVGPFASPITAWCETRQRVEPIDPKEFASSLNAIVKLVSQARDHVSQNANKYSKATGSRAARTVDGLRNKLAETYAFYKDYDPLFDWWVAEPYKVLNTALDGIVAFLREVLVGVLPGDNDTIVGEPIGRDGLLSDLEAEMIPYTPEELLRIAEKEYSWCEAEMIKASEQLGFGTDWHAALEHVKTLYEPPGSYPAFIRSLVNEGSAYVKKHDLVTVPRIAEEAIRMTMIEAEQQKVSPFFLGGTWMQMSYPTREMSHDAKLMSLRGNNRYFSRATAFHEMIPGHHLQVFVGERNRHYRRALFDTPFYVEGWALYWEMVLWDRGDFFRTAEDKVGSLFWRMHRCARILFSVRFHLGLLTPQQCVDMLVEKVGHERATAEGEVRRSLSGEYSPLYQAGYMLGALQLVKLREEAVGRVGAGRLPEKEFHDRILKANVMPIEMLRALILDKELKQDFKSEWRFYDGKL